MQVFVTLLWKSCYSSKPIHVVPQNVAILAYLSNRSYYFALYYYAILLCYVASPPPWILLSQMPGYFFSTALLSLYSISSYCLALLDKWDIHYNYYIHKIWHSKLVLIFWRAKQKSIEQRWALFVCNRGDTYYSITAGSRQGRLAKPLSLLFLTPRPALSSHQHRTLVCLFWSGNLHCAHSPVNPTAARQECFELLDVSNSSNHSFSNT